MSDVLRFPDGYIVDARPCADGKPALLLVDGEWVTVTEDSPVNLADFKDAIVLSEEEIAELPEQEGRG